MNEGPAVPARIHQAPANGQFLTPFRRIFVNETATTEIDQITTGFRFGGRFADLKYGVSVGYQAGLYRQSKLVAEIGSFIQRTPAGSDDGFWQTKGSMCCPMPIRHHIKCG